MATFKPTRNSNKNSRFKQPSTQDLRENSPVRSLDESLSEGGTSIGTPSGSLISPKGTRYDFSSHAFNGIEVSVLAPAAEARKIQIADAKEAIIDALQNTSVLFIGEFPDSSDILHFITPRGERLLSTEIATDVPSKFTAEDILDGFWDIPDSALAKAHVFLHFPSAEKCWSSHQRDVPLKKVIYVFSGARKLSITFPFWNSHSYAFKCSDSKEAEYDQRCRILRQLLFARHQSALTVFLHDYPIKDFKGLFASVVRPFDVLDGPLRFNADAICSSATDNEVVYPATWTPPGTQHTTAYRITLYTIKNMHVSSPHALTRFLDRTEQDSSTGPTSPLPLATTYTANELYYILDATVILSYIVSQNHSDATGDSESDANALWERPVHTLFKRKRERHKDEVEVDKSQWDHFGYSEVSVRALAPSKEKRKRWDRRAFGKNFQLLGERGEEQ